MDAYEDRPTRTALAVGLLTIAVLAGLAFAVAFFLAKERPLAKTFPIAVRFADIAGLKSGAPVTLMGLPIGRVEAFTIEPLTEAEGGGAAWRVDLAIRDEPLTRSQLTTRTTFAVQPESLFGNKFVNASFGEGGRPLAPGAVVAGTVAAGIDARAFEKLSTALDNLSGAAAELKSLLAPSGTAAIGTTPTAAPNLREAMANLGATLDNTSKASTALKEALSDENQTKVRQTFDDISRSASNLANVTERMKTGMDTWNDTMEKMRFWRGWFGNDKTKDKKDDAKKTETR